MREMEQLLFSSPHDERFRATALLRGHAAENGRTTAFNYWLYFDNFKDVDAFAVQGQKWTCDIWRIFTQNGEIRHARLLKIERPESEKLEDDILLKTWWEIVEF